MGNHIIQKKTASQEKRTIKSAPALPKSNTTINFEKIASSDTCSRCGGFMVSHWCMNVNYDAGGMEILTQRCLQCGEVIDPVILENRLNPEREAMKKKTRPLLSRPLASSSRKSSGLSCSPVV